MSIVVTPTDISEALGLTLNGEQLAERSFAHVKRAERYLRARVGDAAYDAASTSSNDENYPALRTAEAMLAVSYALPFINLRITDTGGLSKVIGMNDLESREELISPGQVYRIQRRVKADADEITAHLVAVPADDNDVDSVAAGKMDLFSVKGEEDWLW